MGWFLSRKESPLGGGGDGGDGTPKVDGKQAVELIHGGGGGVCHHICKAAVTDAPGCSASLGSAASSCQKCCSAQDVWQL